MKLLCRLQDSKIGYRRIHNNMLSIVGDVDARYFLLFFNVIAAKILSLGANKTDLSWAGSRPCFV